MAVLLSTALAAALSPALRPTTPAQAAVRIVHAVRITEDGWKGEQPARKRTIIVLDSGRPLVVRVIEFE